jgi:hypothetical protein
MKKLIVFFLFVMPAAANCQIGEKFGAGFMIDRFGQRFEGFLRLEPGDGKKTSELIFKENKKGKKESYGPDYLKSCKIESDSFTVIRNIPLANRKILPADIVKVVLTGSGGVLYHQEFVKSKSTGHAATDFKIEEESSRYLAGIDGKIIAITASNFKEFAAVVADYEDLKTRIQTRKVKYSDLPKLIAEYKTFKSQPLPTPK